MWAPGVEQAYKGVASRARKEQVKALEKGEKFLPNKQNRFLCSSGCIVISPHFLMWCLCSWSSISFKQRRYDTIFLFS